MPEVIIKFLDLSYERGIFLIKPSEVLAVVILVSILYVVLNKNIIKPLNAIIEKREEKFRKSADEFEKASLQFNKTIKNYNESIFNAKAEAHKLREEHRTSAEKYRMECVGKARDEASGMINKALEEIDIAVKTSKKDIEEECEMLADDIVNSMLGSGSGART